MEKCLAKCESESLPDYPDLTDKQRRLVDAILTRQPGETDQTIMERAGYSPGSNTSIMINNGKVREALKIALERQGITTDLIAEVLFDGLTAREDHNDIMSKPERLTRLKFYEKIAGILGIENPRENVQEFSWEHQIQNNIIINQSNDDIKS